MQRKTLTTVSTFGAALAVAGVAPELQADIVPLSFSPGTIPFSGAAFVGLSTNFGLIGLVSAWNYDIGNFMFVDVGIVGIDLVQYSQTITTGFQGTVSIFSMNGSATGTVFIGFTDVQGNHGWFKYDLGGFGNPNTFIEGMYGNAGEAVHVGTIPAPGALALLALGAVGVRRHRKRVA